MTRSDAELEVMLQRGYRYALALCRDPQSAQDLVHDAVAAMLRGQRVWETPYLMRAIRNRWIDTRRRAARSPVAPMDPGHDPGRGGRDGVLARIAGDEAVEQALGVLRDTEREVVYLCWVEGYTAAEAAHATGRPRGTVLSLLHRARAKLRTALGDGRERGLG